MAWLSRCIGDLADERSLVVNEYDLDPTQICRRAPGSYFGSSPASGLGWGLGAAVGAKLAAPDKTVICCVGDGAYYFGAPASTHWVARAQGLPVLFVVFNNGAWNAVKQSVRHHAPDGWAVRTESMPLTALEPALDYELICRAAGGYGERVENPAELPEALGRALRAVQDEKAPGALERDLPETLSPAQYPLRLSIRASSGRPVRRRSRFSEKTATARSARRGEPPAVWGVTITRGWVHSR